MLTCSPNLSVNMPDRLAAIISATIQQNVDINFKPSANFKFQKKYITIQYTIINTFLARAVMLQNRKSMVAPLATAEPKFMK